MSKVSIIIPAYNKYHYTRETIESILKQTYKNTEIIVINDGSTEFVGTPNGLIYTCSTNECGMGWCLEEYSANNPSSDLGIYPNPANSFTNFKCPTSILTGKVDIFNFAMEQVVYNISCSGDGINLECDYDNINLSKVTRNSLMLPTPL